MEIDKHRKERIRWRSRRGLLEMDLILERFLAKHLNELSELELQIYDHLLDLPDNDFLDLAMGRIDATTPEEVALIGKIRNS